jgi:hypothetical protein
MPRYTGPLMAVNARPMERGLFLGANLMEFRLYES